MLPAHLRNHEIFKKFMKNITILKKYYFSVSTKINFTFSVIRAQSLNLSLGALVLPHVNV